VNDGPVPEDHRLEAVVGAARRTRGFMPDDEGKALLRAALRAGRAALPGGSPTTFVEIGAWCGKSSLYVGAAAEATGAVLFSIDHHRVPRRINRDGSTTKQIWSIRRGPDRHAVALAAGHQRGRARRIGGGRVGDSSTVAARWRHPLAFCFIDGGHGAETGVGRLSRLVTPGGSRRLAGHHDVFPDPADGGRPPYELFCAALASGESSRTARAAACAS